MKTIIRVAKTELRTLFYSPIAWFLMIVFLIQCGIVYLGQLDSVARQQELGGYGLQYLNTLTERVFLSPRGLFGSVMQNLYLYIPLLTMSLISRETSSGTIKLLYSSPIKVREIVFGKYVAMMVYSLILVAIVGVFIISGMFHIQNPETGMLLTALLGFYLLLLAYSAIGLFMSTLTTYQVVAAICTFVMIGVLSYIGTLWQRIAFVRELTYFLSINGRTQKLLAGLVTTKDLIYFFAIIYMFLGFSIYKLKGGMESKPAAVKAMRYVMIVASALLIGYVSSIPSLIGYYDATANKSRTITPKVQNILKELGDEPLEVTSYTNLLDNYSYLGSPDSYNQMMARWEPYMRFKHNLKVTNVVYWDSALNNQYLFRSYPGKSLKEIAEQYTKSNDTKLKDYLTPEQIRKMIDLRPEKNRYVMQLKWKGRTTFLRVFDDMYVWPGETEVAAALKRLQQAKLPKIGFITGDLERDIEKMGDRDYKALTNLSTFRNSLVNQGFDVQPIDAESEEIPADIAALVVADPKVELGAATMAKLQQYIDKGGNLLIAGEPGKQAILNPLLKQLGVQINEGMVIQESKELAPNIAAPDMTKFVGTFTKAIQQRVEDSVKISMPGAAGLSWTATNGFIVQPLLVTDAKLTWNRIKPLDLEMMTSASGGGGMAMVSAGGPVMVASASSGDAAPAEPAKAPAKGLSIEEQKKKAAALQKEAQAIMSGSGTQEEKQAKLKALMEKAKKEAEASMTPEQKKTRDSVQTAMAAIMNGPGTMEEKQQKARAMMEKVGKAQLAAQTSAANKPAVAAKKPAVTDEASSEDAPAEGRGRRGRNGIGTVTFSAADGDVKGPITTAVSLTRKVNGKEQRIVVAGDADFMSNSELNRFNLRTANFVFNTALFSWLSYGEFPVDTSRPDAKDKRVNVSMDQVDFLRIVYIWVLPGILLAFGAILLIRRKRK